MQASLSAARQSERLDCPTRIRNSTSAGRTRLQETLVEFQQQACICSVEGPVESYLHCLGRPVNDAKYQSSAPERRTVQCRFDGDMWVEGVARDPLQQLLVRTSNRHAQILGIVIPSFDLYYVVSFLPQGTCGEGMSIHGCSAEAVHHNPTRS